MTEELKQYYSNIVFKDNSQTKYYFDIIGVMNGDGGVEINIPVVTILQNRKAATGAETFKQAIEQLEKNKKVHSVIIKEYNGFFDDAEPLQENRFSLKKATKMKKKDNSLQSTQGGLNGLGAIDQVFKSFGNTLGFMGFQNGLSGIITASAQQIAQQDKLETLRADFAEMKSEKQRLEDLIERLKEEKETLKDDKKKVENDLIDLKRDLKYKEEQWSRRNSLGTLLATAGLGVLGKKLNLDETLSGLLGDNEQTQSQKESSNNDLDSVNINTVNPEIADYVEQINTYLQSLDRSRIKLVTAICQYLSLGDAKLKEVYNFVASQSQRQKSNSDNNVEPKKS